MRSKKPNKRSLFSRFIRFILKIAFLPFFLLIQIIEFKKLFKLIRQGKFLKSFNFKEFIKKSALSALALPLIVLWVGGYAVAFFVIFFIIFPVFPSSVDVNGQSMLPTFNNGESIQVYRYNLISAFIKPIKKEDIVIFENDKTKTPDDQPQEFVKRVVATSGDNVAFKDGFLYVNNQIVEEPYIKNPRSTFGNQFLSDCNQINVPKDDVFVLGDNRANSDDSRYIGFVPIKDIGWILPLERQGKYESGWRDASKDKLQAGLPSFDKGQYYDTLNKIRTDNNLKPLKANTKLENASQKRAEAIIKYDELKVSPDKSKYTPKQAQLDSGYSNIIYGETNTSGYFDSEDLANYWMGYDTKTSVINKDYQDVGIGSAIGQINGCDTQVIVQEFGGYIPPNYKQSDIDGWQKSLNGLNSIQSGWADLKNNNSFYKQHQADVDRINEIISTRISRIESIVSTMSANKWLSSEQNKWTSEDLSLYNEQEVLANKLNGT